MVVFEYNGKTFYADNFEKKLKRLKITKDNVKIISEDFEFIKKDKHLETEYDENLRVYVLDKSNNHTHIFPVNSVNTKPDILKLFENFIWNNETKTGIRNITIDYINENKILLNGIPKYPINRMGDMCELIHEYNW